MTHQTSCDAQTWELRGFHCAVLIGYRRLINPQNLIWMLIAVVAVVDYISFAAQGMTVAVQWSVVAFVMGLYGASVLIGRRNPPAARLVGAFAQIFAFAQVGTYLSYVAMAVSPFPLADGLLSRVDVALGFDWFSWFTWVEAHPTLHFVLAKAYMSVPLQVLGMLLYFCYADARRVDELLLATLLSAAIIIPSMVLLPAVGAWSHYGVRIEPWREDILGLRSHTLLTVSSAQGIVSFPSFHTVLGLLFVNMARGRKWFLPVLVLNLLLIASVMSEGAHYAVDMFGGLAVALVSIATSRSILAWCARKSVVLPVLHVGTRQEVLATSTARSAIPLVHDV